MALNNILESNQYNLYARSETLLPTNPNPGGATTLWSNSSDGNKLYYGNSDISGASGTVTSITQGTGITLSPNPITTTGSVSLSNITGVAGSYSNSSLTVDGQGRITTISSGPVLDGGEFTPTITSVSGAATYTNFLSTYTRYGNYVTVWHRIRITSTTANTLRFTVTIPVASAGVIQIIMPPVNLIGPSGAPATIQAYGSSNSNSNIQIDVTAVAASTVYFVQFNYVYRRN